MFLSLSLSLNDGIIVAYLCNQSLNGLLRLTGPTSMTPPHQPHPHPHSHPHPPAPSCLLGVHPPPPLKQAHPMRAPPSHPAPIPRRRRHPYPRLHRPRLLPP